MKMPKFFYTIDEDTGDIIAHRRNANIGNYCNALVYIETVHPKLQADYCRFNARMIAEMASRGHITCIDKTTRMAGNRWHLTAAGYNLVQSYDSF